MFCPKCGRFIVSPEEKCLICGHIIKKNSRKIKSKNKTNKQKHNTKTKKTKSKNKQKMKTKSKNKKSKKNKQKKNLGHKILGGFLGGKTRIYNARRFNEFQVLGYY